MSSSTNFPRNWDFWPNSQSKARSCFRGGGSYPISLFPALSLTFRTRPRIKGTTPVMIDRKAIPMKMADMGRIINMENSPPDILMDCFRAFSSMGLRMKAKTKGAPSKLVFRIRYPMTPKNSMIMTSTASKLME